MRGKINLILSFIIFLSVIGFVSAEESFIFREDTNFTLELSMGNADLSPCSTCGCMYNIFNQNGSLLYSRQGTNANGYCKKTFVITDSGKYGAEMIFNDSTDHGRASFELKITPTGRSNVSILDNSILIILVALSLIFLILALVFKVPVLGFISSILWILSGIYTMIYGFSDLADLYTRGVGITLIGVGFIIMFDSVYEWIIQEEDS